MLENISYKLNDEFLEVGKVLAKQGDKLTSVYILVDGTIETYVTIHGEEFILDTLTTSGCVFG